MYDDTEGADAEDERVPVAPPNTLAWAARACETAGEQKPPLWRIRPEVLLTQQTRSTPARPNDGTPASGGLSTQVKEKKA